MAEYNQKGRRRQCGGGGEPDLKTKLAPQPEQEEDDEANETRILQLLNKLLKRHQVMRINKQQTS